jgi:hypothetical protein
MAQNKLFTLANSVLPLVGGSSDAHKWAQLAEAYPWYAAPWLAIAKASGQTHDLQKAALFVPNNLWLHWLLTESPPEEAAIEVVDPTAHTGGTVDGEAGANLHGAWNPTFIADEVPLAGAIPDGEANQPEKQYADLPTAQAEALPADSEDALTLTTLGEPEPIAPEPIATEHLPLPAEPLDKIPPATLGEPEPIAPEPIATEDLPLPAKPLDEIPPATLGEPEPIATEPIATEELPLPPEPLDEIPPATLGEPEPIATEVTPTTEAPPALAPPYADIPEGHATIEPPTASAPAAMSISQHTAVEHDTLFTPYHVIDYFASQGIKLSTTHAPKTSFDNKVMSFTQWLKTMKKINFEAQMTQKGTDPAVDASAKASLAKEDVLTEAMAQVLVQQGKNSLAIQLYLKLMLLHPEKSAFFAAQIHELNSSK